MITTFSADEETLIPVHPTGRYIPFRISGDLLFVSGMGPLLADGSFCYGKVGRDVSVELACQHARLVGRHMVAMLSESGLADRLEAMRVFGMVNAAPDFREHTAVINGFSDYLNEVFGDRGMHARSAVGMGSLPHGMTVEIEAQFRVLPAQKG